MAIKRDTLTNLKLNVGNERLYLDVDEMLGNVEIFTRDKEGRDTIELNLPKFESEIAQLRRETMLTEQKHRLLDELLEHASDIRAKYEIDDDLAMQG